MSLIKFNNGNRLFPWFGNDLRSSLFTDDFFNQQFYDEGSLMPAMNVKEQETDYEIEFAAPGFSKGDFEVTIDDGILNVSAEKKEEEEESEEGYTRKEFSYNSFKRSLKLPSTINLDAKVKAIYKNGILKLNLLKMDETIIASKKVIDVK